MGVDTRAMKIIAHRGASKDRPEHTIAAYELAVAQRADGYECDVRLTRDGELVCIHDRTVDRVSDGRGAVSDMTLAQLQELDFGTPAHPANVLTFRELLEFFQDQRHSRPDGGRPTDQQKPELFVETKHPNRYGPRVEYALNQALEWAGLSDGRGVHLISFSPQSLVRFRLINPRVPRILLRREYQRLIRPGLDTLGVVNNHGLPISKARVRPALLGRSEESYVWTADREDDVRWAAKKGVTWLASNYPGRARCWRDDAKKIQFDPYPATPRGTRRMTNNRPARSSV